MACRVHEVIGVDALAHEPALHVGEGDDDRVDAAGVDLTLELFLAQHRLTTASGHLVLGQQLPTSWSRNSGSPRPISYGFPNTKQVSAPARSPVFDARRPGAFSLWAPPSAWFRPRPGCPWPWSGRSPRARGGRAGPSAGRTPLRETAT